MTPRSKYPPRHALVALGALALLVQLTAPARADGMREGLEDLMGVRLRAPNFRATIRVLPGDTDPAAVAAALEARVRGADGAVHECKVTDREIALTGWLPGDAAESLAPLLTNSTVALSEVLDEDADRTLRAARDAGEKLPDGVRLAVDWTSRDGKELLAAVSRDPDALRAYLAAHPTKSGAWVLGPAARGGKGDWAGHLLAPAVITSAHVREAKPMRDHMESWYLGVELTEEGAKLFGDLTARTVRRRIAIVVDGVVDSAPTVMEPIRGGRLRVSFGSQTSKRQAAHQLAARLASPLPGPVELVLFERKGR